MRKKLAEEKTIETTSYADSIMRRIKNKKKQDEVKTSDDEMSDMITTVKQSGKRPQKKQKMMKCHICGRMKPAEDFNYLYKSKDQRMTICKECEHEQKRAMREDKKGILDSLKSVGCAVCGEKDTVCLDFHHYDPKEKEFNMSSALTKPYYKMIEEAAKCIVTCSNCHRKIHAGLISLDEFLPKHEYEYRKLLVQNIISLFGEQQTKKR